MKTLAASTCVWWWVVMVMVMVVTATEHEESAEVGKQLGAFTTVTFDLQNAVTSLTAYSSFLTRLRNAVAGPTQACGLKSTRNTPITGKEYVYAQLKISNTEWVTLGIDVKDLYVWAYQDNVKYNGKYRATFLKDTPSTAKTLLFPDSNKRDTNFRGNYVGANSLVSAAGVTRENLPLGIQSLDGAIKGVYGKPESDLIKGNAEARFFLTAIQMGAEAARFTYMERGIVKPPSTPTDTQTFRNKMVDLQNNWDNISQAIHNAEAARPKCVKFLKPLQVGNAIYETVDSIKNDMGILKYKGNGLSIHLPDEIVGGLDAFLASALM